jgi:peptide/nickel transport system substrate-binding protein
MGSFTRMALGGMAASAAVLALAFATPVQAQGKKTITIVLTDEPTDLDGCDSSQSTVGRVVMQNFYETLTIMDPDTGAVTPLLATSWEQIDLKAWRFHLRKGVKFHDGQAFTAQAAVSAIQRNQNPSVSPGCGNRNKFFGLDKFTFKTPDEHTLEIYAEKPEPILPTRLSQMTLQAPGASELSLTRTAVGTGPYKLVNWATGIEINVVRNEDYWGEKPVVTGGKYIWRKESAVRAAMVKIGEADLTDNIAVQDANDPSMDYSYLNTETSFLRMDPTRPPMNDKRVRLAIVHAIDLESLKEIVSKDALIASQVIIPTIPGHNHELDKKPYTYDPELSKKLLAEAKAAGVDTSIEIEMQGRVNIWQNATETMEAIQQMLQAVGLNVKLRMYDRAQWLEHLNRPHDENRGATLLQGQHDNNFGDAVFSVPTRYTCEGSQSFTCDPDLEALINKAAATAAPERYKLYEEVFRRVHDDFVADAYLYHMVGYTRVNPRIKFKPNASLNAMIPLSRIGFN